MKINPIAIRTYQQLTRPELPARTASESSSLPGADGGMTIAPQAGSVSSRLAVRVSNVECSDPLTLHERKALELILATMTEGARGGAEYGSGVKSAEAGTSLGRIVDVKA